MVVARAADDSMMLMGDDSHQNGDARTVEFCTRIHNSYMRVTYYINIIFLREAFALEINNQNNITITLH